MFIAIMKTLLLSMFICLPMTAVVLYNTSVVIAESHFLSSRDSGAKRGGHGNALNSVGGTLGIEEATICVRALEHKSSSLGLK